MKTKLGCLLMAAACLTFAGCVTKASNDLVPKTAFSITDESGKKISGEFPKDMDVGFAQYVRNTNGTASLTLSNIVSRTNPDVIKESGNAQAAAIKAMGDLYKENLQLLGTLLINGGMKAAAPAPIPKLP
jgi:hypothetical protein